MDEIVKRVVRVIAGVLEVPEDNIEDDSLVEELFSDSLDRTLCLIELEEEFGIEIDDAVYYEAETVGAVGKVIEQCIS